MAARGPDVAPTRWTEGVRREVLPNGLTLLLQEDRSAPVVAVVTHVKAGQLIGCGALHLYGPHLAEIRSITVHRAWQKRGGGELLVQSLMSQAHKHQVSCICLFTRSPQFFAKLGFDAAQREDLPDKINKDCCVCPRYHCCDEVAMVKGEIPRFAILPEAASWLVKLPV